MSLLLDAALLLWAAVESDSAGKTLFITSEKSGHGRIRASNWHDPFESYAGRVLSNSRLRRCSN